MIRKSGFNVAHVKRYIRNNGTRQFSYKKLSEVFKVSATVLRERFIAVYGAKPKEYDTHVELRMIENLVENHTGGLSAVELAAKMEFAGSGSICNFIKRATGKMYQEYYKIILIIDKY